MKQGTGTARLHERQMDRKMISQAEAGCHFGSWLVVKYSLTLSLLEASVQLNAYI